MKPITLSLLASSLILVIVSHVLSHYRMHALVIALDIAAIAVLFGFAYLQGEADRKKKEEKRTLKN